MLHMAMKDRWVQAEVNELLERRLSPNPLVTIHKYPGADHAFARHGGKTYSKPEADRALAGRSRDRLAPEAIYARVERLRLPRTLGGLAPHRVGQRGEALDLGLLTRDERRAPLLRPLAPARP